MIVKTKLKQWGSSLGIVVPSEVVKEEKLSEGSEVIVDIQKKGSLWDIFGTLKDRKLNAQKIKDQARKDWSM